MCFTYAHMDIQFWSSNNGLGSTLELDFVHAYKSGNWLSLGYLSFFVRLWVTVSRLPHFNQNFWRTNNEQKWWHSDYEVMKSFFAGRQKGKEGKISFSKKDINERQEMLIGELVLKLSCIFQVLRWRVWLAWAQCQGAGEKKCLFECRQSETQQRDL